MKGMHVDPQVLENVGAVDRIVKGVVKPSTREELRDVVLSAKSEGLVLYPVSTGKNWGSGSKLPYLDNQVIVDLSALNEIISIDEKFGTARIETAVTQIQLANSLRSNEAWSLDVTGSGRNTSVIGNGLERGVTSDGPKESNLFNFEVMLCDGSIVFTGMRGFSNTQASQNYCKSLGMNLDSLFFQSSLGIVLSADIKLTRKKKNIVYFSLGFNNETMSETFDQYRTLKQDRILNGALRTSSKKRVIESMSPLFRDELEKLNVSMSDADIEKYIAKNSKYLWVTFGAIDGPREIIRYKKRILKKRLSKFGDIRFFTLKNIEHVRKVVKLFGAKRSLAMLNASKSVLGLTHGEPTDGALAMTAWPGRLIGDNVDGNAIGLHFIVPLLPLDGSAVTHLMTHLQKCNEEAPEFNIATTFNTMTERNIEAVITIKFNRPDSKRALSFCQKLTNDIYDLGFPMMRLGVHNCRSYLNHIDKSFEYEKRIKHALDPFNTFSLGRYLPWE